MRKLLVAFLFLIIVFMDASPHTVLKEIIKGWVFVVDSKGFIYSNYDRNEIRKYSPDGRLILKMGRKGQGPGDIFWLGWFAINPKDGNIYVTEYRPGNKRISIFSPEGKYLGEWKIELDWKNWGNVDFIKFDRFGNGYIRVFRNIEQKYKDFLLCDEEYKIIQFSPNGKRKNEFYKNFIISFWCEKRRKGNITIPFQNYLSFDIWEDKIAIKEAVNDFISIYDINGKEIKKLYLPFKKEKLSKDDIMEWIEWHMASWGDRMIRSGAIDPDYLDYWKDRMPFPKYKPVSYGVYFDGRGNIFTKKFIGYKSKESIYARVSISSGEYKIRKLENETIIFIDKDWVYLSRETEEGEEVVVKMKREEFGL